MGFKFDPFFGELIPSGSTSGGGGGPAERYTTTFNNTTDWSGPSGGNYSLSVTQATHTRGTNPSVQVFELVSGNYQLVQPGNIEINVSGDVTIYVNSTPDLRFNGAILII